MDTDDFDFGQTIRGFIVDQVVFGRFRLKSLLGRGGMGVVWLGWDEKLDEQVALKFMPENVRMDEAAIHDLKRETRKSRQLTHPSIVRIHDFFESDETAAIAMEYVDGHTLSSLRLQQPHQIFQPSELEAWIRQLGAALSYAHGTEKVVHRDLKPSNLMVNSRGHLKVTDFGISSTITDSLSRVSMANLSSGSPPYMSPQQLNGKAPSASDDIYSLGATLYELLTGKPPFYRGNIAHQVLEVQARPVSEQRTELTGGQAGLEPIPRHLESGIARCLAKTPEERPRTVEEAVAEILGESAPVSAKISKSPLLLPNNWKRNWPLVAGLLTVLVALAGGVIYKVATSGKPKYEVKPEMVVQSKIPVASPDSQPAERQTTPSNVPAQPAQSPAEPVNPMVAAAEREQEKIKASITPEQFEMVRKIWTRMAMQSSRGEGKPLPMIGANIISLPAYNRMDISADGINLNTKRCNLSGLSDNLKEELGSADHGAWVYVAGQPMPMDGINVTQAKILSPSDMDQAIQEAASFYGLPYQGAGSNADNAPKSAATPDAQSVQTDMESGKSILEQAVAAQAAGNIDRENTLLTQAYPYFKKAADQGNAEALRKIGNYYKNGSVPGNEGNPDLTTALNYYIQAAEKGDGEAAFRASQAYLRGEGADVNWDNMKKYLTLAYNLNSSDVELYVARCSRKGEGPEVQKNGNINEQGKLDIDYKLASNSLLKVIKRGPNPLDRHENENYLKALDELGNMYHEGEIVDGVAVKGKPQKERADYKKAFELYNMAREGGDISGLYFTGECLIEGNLGVHKDIETGKKYINEAANKGLPEAMKLLHDYPKLKISPTNPNPTSTPINPTTTQTANTTR